MRLRLPYILLALLLASLGSGAASGPKMKYPGGKYYICRYTLRDKQGSTHTLAHPGRWLSHKSIERRRRQGLSLDSTDLPVSERYLRTMERMADGMAWKSRNQKTEWALVGTSRWNNTVLVRSNDSTLLSRLGELDFVSRAERVWTSPDSIDRSIRKVRVHEEWNPWDSIRGEYYGNAKEQIEMLSGQRLHSIGCRGRGMTIAVLDGGFQS
jgi:hypothetical protein